MLDRSLRAERRLAVPVQQVYGDRATLVAMFCGDTGRRSDMAAVCLMMQFATMDRSKYDDVMKALDWHNAGPPKGLISHMAGPMRVGWGVVDVWESQDDFDRFLKTRLREAFQEVGARMPVMQITVFQVHNQYP